MNIIKKEKKYWIVLGAVLLVLICAQIFIPALGDDALFSKLPLSVNLLVKRYNTWSSRIFIEAVLIFLAKQMWLFRILNAFVFILLIDTFAKITIGRNIKSLLLILLFFLLLPVTLFMSAGWLATSLNYLWPITFAFYVATQLDNKLGTSSLLMLSLLLFFATNQEQVCVAMLILLISKLISDWFGDRNIKVHNLLFIAITLVNLAIIALCPGNAVRTSRSIKSLFPQFAEFSVWDKINLGISHTSKLLLFQQNILMLVFLVLLALVLIITLKKWWIALIAICPLIIVLPINVFFSTLTQYGYNVNTFSKYLLEKQSSSALNKIIVLISKLLNNDVSLFWNTVFVLLFIFILISLYFLKENISIVFYFLIGLATHAMMGFSPTIFKSGDRTAFILYMVMVYILLLMVKKLLHCKEKNFDE